MEYYIIFISDGWITRIRIKELLAQRSINQTEYDEFIEYALEDKSIRDEDPEMGTSKFANLFNCDIEEESFEDVDPEIFDKIMDVNVKAPWSLSNLVLPHFQTNKKGSIINIASVEALTPGFGLGLYSTSKAAILMLTKNQAKEWGRYGVKANDTVRKGQYIGKGGRTGNARGSHLHLVVNYKLLHVQ